MECGLAERGGDLRSATPLRVLALFGLRSSGWPGCGARSCMTCVTRSKTAVGPRSRLRSLSGANLHSPSLADGLGSGPRGERWRTARSGGPDWVAQTDCHVAGENVVYGAIYYPAMLPQHQTRVGGPVDDLGMPAAVEEPLQAELLAAIQGSRVALEGKIETVAVEVNLFRADLRKVSDKVKVAEGSIVDLQTEVGTLRKQMVQATSKVGVMEARLKDAEGGGWWEEVNDGRPISTD
ncbi:hypothetical protein NDU88_000375 [Pleurodeles waltl]|uniref:Uncharacterized protein n=1 Tax=Pleurodeles waltl TaxID=8319 RepID=A0AAV7U7B9_PLEWA|nr:hypothetical protein NDU88_000375 [Pleurodeles waltl]